MELSKKLTAFLRRHKIFYQVQVHPETATALETAEVQHVCGKSLAKVVMVKAGGKDIMVVIPCDRNVDLLKLSTVLGTEDVRIAEEAEFAGLFSDCELGAMPPFGRVYKIPSYADKRIGEEKDLYFSGGNHQETVKISAADFLKNSKAFVADLSVPAHCFAQARKVEKNNRLKINDDSLFIGEAV